MRQLSLRLVARRRSMMRNFQSHSKLVRRGQFIVSILVEDVEPRGHLPGQLWGSGRDERCHASWP
jgi:hypothetical protein